MKTRFLNKSGFTLIELLIVMAIIGVLVAILIVAINPVSLINNATDSRRRSDLNQIKAAMQLYYNDCKAYPASITFGSQFGPIAGGNACDDSTTYMKQVPNATGATYTYSVDGTNANYEVTTRLNTRTTEDTNTINKCAATISGAYADGAEADFVVCND